VADPPGNILYYGDNLDVLQQHIPDESVDLVYLDPPFNSNANYSVLFGHTDGTKSAAQIKAFDDTWTWDTAAAAAFQGTVLAGGNVASALTAFQTLLGPSTMLAYLAMMAPRLVALRRVLKPSGSLYLHCDPTASHYLKLLLDAVFGPEMFRNEIVWQRVAAKGGAMHRLPANHDIILAYARTASAVWKEIRLPYDHTALDAKTLSKYAYEDNGRRYRLGPLLHPEQGRRPNLEYELMGVVRTWRWSRERMAAAVAAGRVIQTAPGRVPQQKMFLDEQPGRLVGDVWTDIGPLNSQAAERLGYPTQKPEALLERIIAASCPDGGVVLDPFCGCGTTIAAAQKMKRRWVGIDVTYLAISLIKSRLTTLGTSDYHVVGEPITPDDAAQLAADDPYQFQWWALGLIGARPAERKKGADHGIDGRLYFFDEGADKPKQAIVSVKAGKVQVSHVRDLRGVLDREKAELGVLISFNGPTQPMRTEAASAGFYTSPWGHHPRIQLLTVTELLEGKKLDMPAGGAHMTQVALPPTPEPTVHPDQLSLGG
jgi:DNA modification methylase